MCEALPGRRCSTDTFKAYDRAKRALDALPENATGIQRGEALTAYNLAAADYAATFAKQNPALHAAATRIRDEQVALMPTKPAINEAGHKEYERLAKARHRLASVLTAARDAELAGNASYETTQVVYEAALFDVQQAEKDFRRVAWHHYDITEPAQSELVAAMESGDEERLAEAKALFYLSQHRTWPQDADERAREALATGDQARIDAAYRERDAAHDALARMPQLIERAYPHTVLGRERPGGTMPPAPWVGQGRPVDPCDTPQVRYLCEGGCDRVRWDRTTGAITVRNPNQATVNRLWAYGYHTEPGTDPATLRIARGPVVSERRRLPSLAEVS